MEIWRDILGYEGLYQISNYGNVMSLNYRRQGFAKQLTAKCSNTKRLWVELAKDGVRKPVLIHRLVAEAFIPNPNGYPQINHKDGNPQNNHVDNLEWCTQEYNIQHFYNHIPSDWFSRRKSTDKYSIRTHIPVEQLTLDGELVKRWNNTRQLRVELKWNDWSINECCKGNRKTAYGYIWRYASESR